MDCPYIGDVNGGALMNLTFIIDNEELLIERVSGMENLNKLKPINKLKILETIRNKIEREILSMIYKVERDYTE